MSATNKFLGDARRQAVDGWGGGVSHGERWCWGARRGPRQCGRRKILVHERGGVCEGKRPRRHVTVGFGKVCAAWGLWRGPVRQQSELASLAK